MINVFIHLLLSLLRFASFCVFHLNFYCLYEFSVYVFIVLVIGFLTLTASTPTYVVFIWGGFVGIGLGWLYAVEPLYLSCLVPRGQEAEIAGFYNFVTVILAWAPTLVFSVCTESEVEQQLAFLAAVCFFHSGD